MGYERRRLTLPAQWARLKVERGEQLGVPLLTESRLHRSNTGAATTFHESLYYNSGDRDRERP